MTRIVKSCSILTNSPASLVLTFDGGTVRRPQFVPHSQVDVLEEFRAAAAVVDKVGDVEHARDPDPGPKLLG